MDNEFENQTPPVEPVQPPTSSYQPNYYVPNTPNQGEMPLSVGEWILTIIILAIPCVNLIMMFVWGFGNGNISRRNFCRAYLIVYLVAVVLGIILGAIFGSALFSILNNPAFY